MKWLAAFHLHAGGEGMEKGEWEREEEREEAQHTLFFFSLFIPSMTHRVVPPTSGWAFPTVCKCLWNCS